MSVQIVKLAIKGTKAAGKFISRNSDDVVSIFGKKNTKLLGNEVSNTAKFSKEKSFWAKVKNFFGFRTKLNPRSFSDGKPTPKFPYLASRESVKQSNRYLNENYISSREKIVDGFRDGGHSARYDKFGQSISGNREVVTIDKALDTYLSSAIKYAKENTKNMSEKDKMQYIYNIVHDISGDAKKGEEMADILAKHARGNEVLLGKIFEKGCASCRHKALMFKILADEVGLNARMIRGQAFDLSGFGGHAWNEIILSNGKRILVDVQNSRVVDVAKAGKSTLAGYLTQSGKQIY